jgi:hypothetical protein
MSAAAPASTSQAKWFGNRLDVCALWYLALPNLIFLATWIKPLPGIAASVVLAAALVFMSLRTTRASSKISPMAWAMVIAVALVWVGLSGVGHFVYANTDWAVRDSVLNDLSTRAWPVEYTIRGQDIPVLLRAPIGYFLPAAAATQLFGVGAEEMLLFVWTLIGVVITFLYLVANCKRTATGFLLLIIFMLFSGLDIVGYFVTRDFPALGEHLEWWAGLFQYSSITTQLFWVPNHALPGWIVTLWLLRHSSWRTISPTWTIVLIAMTPLWSPLAAIGLAVLGATVIIARFIRPAEPTPVIKRVVQVINPTVVAVSAISLGLIAPYLTIAGGTVPARWLVEGLPFVPLLKLLAGFMFIEFGLFWILMWKHYRFDLLLTTAGILLMLLPWYRFGPFSDLTMRASIPALVVFAVRLGDWLSERLIPAKGMTVAEDGWASLAMLAVVIGMVTPFQEIIRAFIVTPNAVDLSVTVYQATGGEATHYLANREGRFADTWMAPGHPPPQSAGEVRIPMQPAAVRPAAAPKSQP